MDNTSVDPYRHLPHAQTPNNPSVESEYHPYNNKIIWILSRTVNPDNRYEWIRRFILDEVTRIKQEITEKTTAYNGIREA